ncbi:hypothetical protein CYI56_08260, partial [Campylobacter upsaliensis]|nr:hypothetical protein [Campylobacter upsaliensis]
KHIMSREIENFLEILKDPQKHFGINVHDLSTCKAYEYEKYDCEIALLHKCHLENDPDNEKLLSTFRDIFSKDYLELRHPFHNDVVTRAVLSIEAYPTQSFVFFIDENNQYPWILYHMESFVLFFITPKNIFTRKNFLRGWYPISLFNNALNISKFIAQLKTKDLEFKDKKFGINFNIDRPCHTFSDFNWFNKLHLQNCKVINSPMFFKTNTMTNFIDDDDIVKIRPGLIDYDFHIKNNFIQEYIDEALEAHGGGGI